MDSITLSGNEFRALASETRVELIKLLQQRNHTLSELSQKTSLAAPTVKQHLSVLETAGLVELFDEGRKWKYYSLTRKGKKILSKEEPKNILIVLAAGIIGVAATLYSFLGMFSMENFGNAAPEAIRDTAPSAAIATDWAQKAAAGAVQQALPLAVETAAVLAIMIIFFSLLIGFAIAKIRKK